MLIHKYNRYICENKLNTVNPISVAIYYFMVQMTMACNGKHCTKCTICDLQICFYVSEYGVFN